MRERPRRARLSADPIGGRRLALAAVAIGLAVLAYLPAFIAWRASGWGDWQWFHQSWEVGRVSILRFGEVPLWNPHHCGGVPMWGQPQSQLYSPTWWVTGLLFGTVLGHKLYIVLHHAVGFAGIFVVGRRLYGLPKVAATVAAIAWALGGYMAWRSAGGHSPFLAFHYLPWVLLYWRRTHRAPRYGGVVAALMTLILLEGGTYPFPLTVLFLTADSLGSLLRRRPEWAVFRSALYAGGLTLVMGAIRLWPVWETMRRFPRNTQMEDSQTLADLLASLTAREPHPWQWGHRWVWAEYGAYVGWATLGLAAVGAIWVIGRRRHLHLVLGAIFFGAVAMGNRGELWPWPLLHELPVFSSFHVPSRFHVLLAFQLALLAGIGLALFVRLAQREARRVGMRRAAMLLAWFLVVAIGVDVVSNTIRVAARWDGPPMSAEREDSPHLVSTRGYLEEYSRYPARDVGTAACYDPVPWEVSRHLWVGEVPQVRFEPRAAGELLEYERTNHRVSAELRLEEPARVIFNQNFDPDWRVTPGTPVSDRGRLAIDLPAGEHTVRASYRPSDLPYSWLSTLGAIGIALMPFAARAWRRRRRAPGS